jgi:hypothetical protein
MKIALCLSGYVGRKDKIEKSISNREYICLDYSSKFTKNYIVNNNNVDIFIHSFDVNLKNEILKTYNVVDSIIENQKTDFNVNSSYFHIVSQLYSKMKVVELKKLHEEKMNIKYDWVVLGRFDIGYSKVLNFLELNNDNIYISDGWNNHPNTVRKIQDIIFISNSDNMNIISDIYNSLDKLKLNHNIHYTEYDYFVYKDLIKKIKFYFKNEGSLHKSNDNINIFHLRSEKNCVWRKL